MRRGRRFACLATLLGMAACGDDSHGQTVVNRCTQAFECPKADKSKCDQQLGICVREKFDRPYGIVVLAIPDDEALTRTSTAPMTLTEGQSLPTIKVRRAITVYGTVTDNQESPFNAEVAFIPEAIGLLTGGVSAFTQPDKSRPNYSFSAALEPDTSFDVRVFPTGNDSERLPPQLFTLSSAAASAVFNYPTLQARRATFLDENKNPPPVGSKVRLRNKVSQLYVSSIGKPNATSGQTTSGQFILQTTSDVLSSLAEHELVLDVPFGATESVPFGATKSVSIVFDASLFQGDATLVTPVIPATVYDSFSVEVVDPNNDRITSAVSADVTFISGYPLPTESGLVSNRDWCQLRLPGSVRGTFFCQATVKISVTGNNSVELLPGDYQVYLVPREDGHAPFRVATTVASQNIETPSKGAPQQMGRAFPLTPAVVYPGSVNNFLGQPMPGVTVTANALGVKNGLAEIARFNRSVSQVSDQRGQFQLAVDTGYYDLIATPPDHSGFAWVVNPNRAVVGNTLNSSVGQEAFSVQPESPVIVRGAVVAEGLVDGGGAAPLAEARIEAYAIVPDLSTGDARAVRIAKTVSDDHGNFALMLAPYIGEPPKVAVTGDASTPSLSTAELDAGVGLDASH